MTQLEGQSSPLYRIKLAIHVCRACCWMSGWEDPRFRSETRDREQKPIWNQASTPLGTTWILATLNKGYRQSNQGFWTVNHSSIFGLFICIHSDMSPSCISTVLHKWCLYIMLLTEKIVNTGIFCFRRIRLYNEFVIRSFGLCKRKIQRLEMLFINQRSLDCRK